MSRLIKAEVYRFIHSGSYIRIFLVSCLLLMFFPLAMDYELLDRNLTENIGNLSTGLMIFLMFGPVILAVTIASGYTKKTAYYEVMAGSKIGSIIGSKIFVEGIILGVIILIFIGGLGIICTLKNGVGELDGLGVRLLLLLVVCLHITIVSVLFGLAIKNIAAGMLAYFRFAILELMVMLVMPLLQVKEVFSKETCNMVNGYLLMNQISEVFAEKISKEIVMAILVSFLVEVVLWYGITYYTMKKRLYK